MNGPRYLKAWIIFILVSSIGGFLLGAVLGGIAGVILAILHRGDAGVVEGYRFFFQALGFIAALPVSYFVYRWSVSKYIIPQVEKDKPAADDTLMNDQSASTDSIQA